MTQKETPEIFSIQTGARQVVNLQASKNNAEIENPQNNNDSIIEYEIPNDIPIPEAPLNDTFNNQQQSNNCGLIPKPQNSNIQPEQNNNCSPEFQFQPQNNNIPEPEINNNIPNFQFQPQTKGIPKIQQPKQNHVKYNIIDLFWLHYETPSDNKNEAQFVQISYNIDFGNLKINFYDIPKNAVQENIVFHKSLKLIVSGTIYPSSCIQMDSLEECEFTCIEQLINNTGEQWQKERPICILSKTKNNIISFFIF